MTAEEKLSAIRTEIERLLDCEPFSIKQEAKKIVKATRNGVLHGMLTFINSLPEEPISNDLGEEIHLFLDKTGAPYYWAGDKEQLEWLEIIARHFAEWQKQQMIKSAVDIPLYLDGDFLTLDNDFSKMGYREGEKVKIIIIKEADRWQH